MRKALAMPAILLIPFVVACGGGSETQKVEGGAIPATTTAAAGSAPAGAGEATARTAMPTWPPLPPGFAGDFTMDLATMKKLAGDSIALPIGGQFTALSIVAVQDDGTVRIKDAQVDAALGDHRFKVTIHALHSHAAEDAKGAYAMGSQDSKDAKAAYVWYDFHVQRPGHAALHVVGVCDAGKLLGYTYERTELAKLGPGTVLPVFGGSGWQAFKIDAGLVGETLQVSGGGRLRLLDVGGGRAGLVPAPE